MQPFKTCFKVMFDITPKQQKKRNNTIEIFEHNTIKSKLLTKS